jgi:hypothetical protein
MNDRITYECGCWYDFEYDYGVLVLDEYGTQFGLCDKHYKMIDDE